MSTLLEKIWAICDHFEGEKGEPVRASILKRSSGVSRSDLRNLVRSGQLEEFDVTSPTGSVEKAYFRPKPVHTFMGNEYEVFAGGKSIGTVSEVTVKRKLG